MTMTTEPAIVTLAAHAMATRFEVVLWGRDRRYLEAAGEEALKEIHRLEAQLSFYRDTSDISDLNARAARARVPVDPRLLRLLERAKQLSAATGGAFDITVAPLLRAWGFVGGSGRMADPEEVEAARALVGMELVELDPEECTVHYAAEGVTVDLGAIGKGYAVDQAAEILRDLEVPGALLHGGTSSVAAVGAQPDGSPWRLAIQDPTRAEGEGYLREIALVDSSLSVSAVHGKFFTEGDTRFGHVLDPRVGRPAQGALLAAVVCPSGTDADALSTALLVRGADLFPALAAPPLAVTGALVAMGEPGGPLRVETFGLE